MAFRATLNFQKFKVALNATYKIFFLIHWKKTEILHKTENLAGTDIALESEEKKKKLLQALQSMNAAEQGLTLLSGRDAVLSLWYDYDST